MRHYEVVFLVHPDQSDQVPGMIDRYTQLMKDGGGSVHRVENWGRRQLAYPINKVHKAHYVLMNIACDAATLEELITLFRFNDAVLRNLVVKMKKAVTGESFILKFERESKERRARAEQRRRQEAEAAAKAAEAARKAGEDEAGKEGAEHGEQGEQGESTARAAGAENAADEQSGAAEGAAAFDAGGVEDIDNIENPIADGVEDQDDWDDGGGDTDTTARPAAFEPEADSDAAADPGSAADDAADSTSTSDSDPENPAPKD